MIDLVVYLTVIIFVSIILFMVLAYSVVFIGVDCSDSKNSKFVFKDEKDD